MTAPLASTAAPEKKGPLAVLTGGLLVMGGILLSSLCCWAPALIIGLGLSSVFAVLHGLRGLFIGAGAALIVAGLAWIVYQRRQGSCGCQKEPTP